MSNFIEQLLAMEAGECDAIVFQTIEPILGSSFDRRRADGIVRRLETIGGYQWAFHTLRFGMTGSGIYGDINDITKAVEKAFGTFSDQREWIQVNYTDPCVPLNLLPTQNPKLTVEVGEFYYKRGVY